MKSVALNAHPRSLARRKGAKAVRANGRIPAVIYGRHNPAQNLEVDATEFDLVVHQAHSEIILVDLAVPGDANAKRMAIVQDVQHHPLSGDVLHIDFHEVHADETVTIEVPVEAVGTPEGVKTGGGTLEHVRFRLRVRCLPGDLPEQINVDVSALKVGQTLHIGELVAPKGVELMGDKAIPVFAVSAPVVEEAAATATPAEGDAKQPEMIKEKKEDGTAPAADAKAGDKKPAADKKK
ncbi:MAG TPA: 50S ribosomal protein L25 [Candidatus Limnocylindria bacterium]|jgi:large subunit ribosomal protein L25|nr:50S ribosomal protein L25 [Candidatus Limnocylindria bacterium]